MLEEDEDQGSSAFFPHPPNPNTDPEPDPPFPLPGPSTFFSSDPEAKGLAINSAGCGLAGGADLIGPFAVNVIPDEADEGGGEKEGEGEGDQALNPPYEAVDTGEGSARGGAEVGRSQFGRSVVEAE